MHIKGLKVSFFKLGYALTISYIRLIICLYIRIKSIVVFKILKIALIFVVVFVVIINNKQLTAVLIANMFIYDFSY